MSFPGVTHLWFRMAPGPESIYQATGVPDSRSVGVLVSDARFEFPRSSR
jgi:hypothetical protein